MTFFDIIAGGDTFPEMKPSPLPLLKVIEGFGCSPADALMVGDSINDIQAGNLAESPPSDARGVTAAHEELYGADYRAASPAEVLSIITRTVSP